MLVELTRRHYDIYGDAGLLALQLAAALSRAALEQQLPPHAAGDGYAEASRRVTEWLHREGDTTVPAKSLSWGGSSDLTALLASCILAKPLLASMGRRAAAVVANITLQAFLASLNEEVSPAGPTSPGPPVAPITILPLRLSD